METKEIISDFFIGTTTTLAAVASGASLAAGTAVGALSIGIFYNPLFKECGKGINERLEKLLGEEAENLAEAITITALQILFIHAPLLLISNYLGIGSFSLLQAGACSVASFAMFYDDSAGYEILSTLTNKVDTLIKSMYPPVRTV